MTFLCRDPKAECSSASGVLWPALGSGVISEVAWLRNPEPLAPLQGVSGHIEASQNHHTKAELTILAGGGLKPTDQMWLCGWRNGEFRSYVIVVCSHPWAEHLFPAVWQGTIIKQSEEIFWIVGKCTFNLHCKHTSWSDYLPLQCFFHALIFFFSSIVLMHECGCRRAHSSPRAIARGMFPPSST